MAYEDEPERHINDQQRQTIDWYSQVEGGNFKTCLEDKNDHQMVLKNEGIIKFPSGSFEIFNLFIPIKLIARVPPDYTGSYLHKSSFIAADQLSGKERIFMVI